MSFKGYMRRGDIPLLFRVANWVGRQTNNWWLQNLWVTHYGRQARRELAYEYGQKGLLQHSEDVFAAYQGELAFLRGQERHAAIIKARDDFRNGVR